MMARKNGPWTVHESKVQYDDGFIRVREDQVTQPDGEPGLNAVVEMKPGVAVLAVGQDPQGELIAYLTRQFRYAIERESLEVVGGGLEEEETPLEAAQRELEEELGIQADDWTALGKVDVDTSLVCCPVHLFLAQG